MSGHDGAPRGYRFGVFEVECAAAVLRRDGTVVRLRGKPYDVLVHLLERPGQLVTREALRQQLWGVDTFVDFEHGLNAAMNRLRTALGDSAENPRFIQTVPRKGYRFVAPVEVLRAPGPVAPSPEALEVPSTPALTSRPVDVLIATPVSKARRRAAMALALTVLGAAGWWWAPTLRSRDDASTAKVMLAVLPFRNLSGAAEQDYFSDGFTEELIAQLGGLNPSALGVIARSTVARYRDGYQNVQDVGRALHVRYVLEGSVRRAGGRVRITAQLVDAMSQTQLWAESYEHDVGDVLLAQRDVAMRVADALAMSVLRTEANPRMPSPEAYDASLRGRALRLQGTVTSLGRAAEYFERAIELDPSYAPAHAGLADVFHLLGGPGWEVDRPRELLLKAQASARRALELDSMLPHGYAVRGLTRLWLDGDVVGAEADMRRAIAINGSFALAHQYLSTVLVVSGRRDEAILSARRALQLDPLAPSSGTTYAYRLYYADRLADALGEFDRALEGAPDYVSAWLGKAQTLRAMGRVRESRQALDEATRRASGRSYVRAYLAYALGTDGDLDAARAILDELTMQARTSYVSPFHFALAAAGTGDVAAVRRHIARLVEDGSGWAVFVPIERELRPFLDVTATVARR